jgi:hypothetical protein
MFCTKWVQAIHDGLRSVGETSSVMLPRGGYAGKEKLCPPLVLKPETNILPRQARDRSRKHSQKGFAAFSQEPGGTEPASGQAISGATSQRSPGRCALESRLRSQGSGSGPRISVGLQAHQAGRARQETRATMSWSRGGFSLGAPAPSSGSMARDRRSCGTTALRLRPPSPKSSSGESR